MKQKKEGELFEIPKIRDIYSDTHLAQIINNVDEALSIGYGSSREKVSFARGAFMAYELGCKDNLSVEDAVRPISQGYDLGEGLLNLFDFNDFYEKLEGMPHLFHPKGMMNYIKNFSFYSAQKNLLKKDKMIGAVKTFFLDGKESLNSKKTFRNLGNLESALIFLKYCYSLK